MSITPTVRRELLDLTARILRHTDAIREAFEPADVPVRRPPVSPDDSAPPTDEERERLDLPESMRPH